MSDVIARIDGMIWESRRIAEEQISVQVRRGSARVGEVLDPSATYKTGIDRLVSQCDNNVLIFLAIIFE